MNLSETDKVRFWTLVSKGDTCWNWTGRLFASGYGAFSLRGVSLRAHRVSFALANLEIEPGMEIHHTCENKRCVNPEHLEEMTVEEHRALQRKPYCSKGHPMRSPNLIYKRGSRICKTCHYEANRERHARRLQESRAREGD